MADERIHHEVLGRSGCYENDFSVKRLGQHLPVPDPSLRGGRVDGLLKCVDCWVGWLDEHCAGADRLSLKRIRSLIWWKQKPNKYSSHCHMRNLISCFSALQCFADISPNNVIMRRTVRRAVSKLS